MREKLEQKEKGWLSSLLKNQITDDLVLVDPTREMYMKAKRKNLRIFRHYSMNLNLTEDSDLDLETINNNFNSEEEKE